MSGKEIFTSTDSHELLLQFFAAHDYFTEEEKPEITKAWELLVENTKEITRTNGEPYYVHPLRVADILSQNKLDCPTIISALLHSINQYGVTTEQVRSLFGDMVANITDTTNKILNIPINTKTLHQSDAIRKMFFAMSDDVRIIFISLADRLDRMRNINNIRHEYQKVIAEAAIAVWAPLAERMGMQKEKNEFEDLSLKYTNPDAYLQIKSIVSQSSEEQAEYLGKATQAILKATQKVGLTVTIQSRAKHFYSIYQKMRKRNKEASELYDLLALRILCQTPAECYALIGIVHSLWKPLDGRFKDYIAMPKSNGYQSLHTTVMCGGKPLEIQIRTVEMHNMAEHGIASHWLYKKGSNKDLVEEDKLDIINRLQALKQASLSDDKSFSELKDELLGDEIYVFTPKGDVKRLRAGATAIDFAYAIHSDIGEKIVGAKADGKIIPLNRALKNTQIIEIITNPQAHPTEAQLKIVKTTKAHQKIHSWLMANDPTFSERINAATTTTTTTNAGSGAGSGSDTATQEPQKKRRPKRGIPPVTISYPDKKVLVQGEKNVLYNLAQCCHPHYPDLIMGYVTRTKGVSVHRADCIIYQRIPNKDERSVQVEWEK
ncbi:MAG: bifunctional (p)ppGpp synthetase/guanosine-3',5'-bis(diphosphate) 3'-pyrophosphohydrolase [Treponema sp.]|nr:bifunctional (p)ppGpp synthetase/guanosine-3',5'-bis(diphosphate) 3'-pyrophosphohydrolase [Treponema sp.]